jgi:hypothetical protein
MTRDRVGLNGPACQEINEGNLECAGYGLAAIGSINLTALGMGSELLNNVEGAAQRGKNFLRPSHTISESWDPEQLLAHPSPLTTLASEDKRQPRLSFATCPRELGKTFLQGTAQFIH